MGKKYAYRLFIVTHLLLRINTLVWPKNGGGIGDPFLLSSLVGIFLRSDCAPTIIASSQELEPLDGRRPGRISFAHALAGWSGVAVAMITATICPLPPPKTFSGHSRPTKNTSSIEQLSHIDKRCLHNFGAEGKTPAMAKLEEIGRLRQKQSQGNHSHFFGPSPYGGAARAYSAPFKPISVA